MDLLQLDTTQQQTSVIESKDQSPTKAITERDRQCEICNKTFDTSKQLNRHSKRHEKLHNCPKCNKLFSIQSDLQRHKKTHSYLYPKFACPKAGCSFKGAARKDNLLKHLRKSHQDSSSLAEYKESVESQKTFAENVKWLSLVEMGNKKALLRLLSIIGINDRTESGKNALHLAALHGHAILIPILLEHGCDPKARDLIGNLPIHDGCGSGHFEVVKALVSRHDGRINDINNDGRTALSLAAEQGNPEVFQWLLDYAKSVDYEGNTGQALELVEDSHGVKVPPKFEEFNIDLKDKAERTPLSYAAAMGHEAIVQQLLTTGKVYVGSGDIHYRTPLSWAAGNGHEAVVRLFAERKDANVERSDIWGWTPLAWAVANGHEAVVRLLAERDDVEVDRRRPYSGRTPLSFAAANGHEAVVRLLVERDDVEANSKNWCNRTPLSFAAEKGHEAVVRLLVERDDVKANSKDRYDQTPLSWAIKNGHDAVIKMLQSMAS